MKAGELRELQALLKERYRAEPEAALVTLRAHGRLGDEGLPVSMQVLGQRCTDGAVLAAAQAIEQVIGFDARPEPPEPGEPLFHRQCAAS